MVLPDIGVSLAYGSLAIATLGIIFFGLIRWDRQSEGMEQGKKKPDGSAAA